MGLNGGIIKHPNIAGLPSAAAASRRIDDELTDRRRAIAGDLVDAYRASLYAY